MPEIGFEVEPTSPVSREETVTKTKPKMTIKSAPSTFICSDGASVMAAIKTRAPTADDLHRHVALRARGDFPGSGRHPGQTRCHAAPSGRHAKSWATRASKLMMPPAATAPAPM